MLKSAALLRSPLFCRACWASGIEHRLTKPDHPRTMLADPPLFRLRLTLPGRRRDSSLLRAHIPCVAVRFPKALFPLPQAAAASEFGN